MIALDYELDTSTAAGELAARRADGDRRLGTRPDRGPYPPRADGDAPPGAPLTRGDGNNSQARWDNNPRLTLRRSWGVETRPTSKVV